MSYNIDIGHERIDNKNWIFAGTSLLYEDNWFEVGLYGRVGYTENLTETVIKTNWGVKGGDVLRIKTPTKGIQLYGVSENLLLGVFKVGIGLRGNIKDKVLMGVEKKYSVSDKSLDTKFNTICLTFRF